MRDEVPFGITDEKLFFRIVRGAFQNRRKTLVNALASVLSMNKGDIASVISACGHNLNVRGETLSTEAFAKISKEISKKLVGSEH
jgi:16S rRNA (adenine1518-N6/adenine1519-N6)-dimethyltransferase